MSDRTPIYAMFNKKNREFTAWITDITGFPDAVRTNMLLREVILEDYGITDAMFNPERYQWHGDYDTGRFVDLLAENKAIVTETEVNEKYDGLFFKKYEIKDVLYHLIQNTTMTTPAGIEMQSYLNTLLTRKKNDVDYYLTSGIHIYQTEEEEKKRQQLAFQ